MKKLIKTQIILIAIIFVIAVSSSGCQVFQKISVSFQVRQYVNVLKNEDVSALMSMLSQSYITRVSSSYYNKTESEVREIIRKNIINKFNDDFVVTGSDLSYIEIIIEGDYANVFNIYLKGRFGEDEEDVFREEYIRFKKENGQWKVDGSRFLGYY